MADSLQDPIPKLEQARHLVLSDAIHYPQILRGILPIISVNADIEVRRWGAAFIAEAFANPLLDPSEKEVLAIDVLPLLRLHLESQDVNNSIAKPVIQAATSIYGYVFRYVAKNPPQAHAWENMSAMKSNILRRWDSAPKGVQICGIKFIQRVVQVQTPGIMGDPRRMKMDNDISIELVPSDHPVLKRQTLEAEASGLLDRLLNVFYEEHSDAVLVTATLNCIGTLIRTRHAVANKIINAVINFNPFKHATPSASAKEKVQLRSMERTARALLLNLYRRNENSPTAPRIKQHIERLNHIRQEVFEEGSRKRVLTDTGEGPDSVAKRARLNGHSSTPAYPPLPPPPVTVAQLYSLTSDENIKAFSVNQLPQDLVLRIALALLQRLDQTELNNAINGVRSRLLNLGKPTPGATAGMQSLDDDDEYEPDYEPTEDSEQVINAMDGMPKFESTYAQAKLALAPFQLPPPPYLTREEAEQLGKGTISRVFSMISSIKEPSKLPKAGLNRIAGNNHDKDAWITLITRLATRAPFEIDEPRSQADTNGVSEADGMPTSKHASSMAESIRETLWKYVVEDFRLRIPLATAWLNEEWYNEIVRGKAERLSREKNGKTPPPPTYQKWLLKILDGIMPYLDVKDRVLIKFLSEIPAIDKTVLDRVRDLAKDPDRISLTVQTLLYLIHFRPPVREPALDALEDLWRNFPDARAAAGKHLSKWRPETLEESGLLSSYDSRISPATDQVSASG